MPDILFNANTVAPSLADKLMVVPGGNDGQVAIYDMDDALSLPGRFKTIGGQSILGSGNIPLSGGGGGGLGTRIVSLSESGIISDSVLWDGVTLGYPHEVDFGGENGSDQTAAIQAIFTKDPDEPLVVMWDVKATVREILIDSNTTVIALPGCGGIKFYDPNEAPGVDGYCKSIFRNIHFFDSLNDVNHPILNRNIAVRGGIWNQHTERNFLFNGMPMKFFGVNNLQVTNSIVIGAGFWAIHNWFCNDVVVENCILSCLGALQFNGKCDNLFINNNRIYAHDDHIALNADDIFLQPNYIQTVPMVGPEYLTIAGGMTNIRINGNTFIGGRAGIRLLSSSSLIDNVFITNNSGYTGAWYWCVIDKYWPKPEWVPNPGDGNIGTVVFENNNITVEDPYDSQAGPIPQFIHVSGINISTSIRNLYFNNTMQERDSVPFGFPKMLFWGTQTVIENLFVDGYTVLEDVTGYNPAILLQNQAWLKNFFLSNSIMDMSGAGAPVYSPFVRVEEGSTVSNFKASNVTMLNCAPLLDIAANGYTDRVTAVGIRMDATQTYGVVAAATPLPLLTLSGFDGDLTHSGTVTVTNGDAFANDPVPDAAPYPLLPGYAPIPITTASGAKAVISKNGVLYTASPTDSTHDDYLAVSQMKLPAGQDGAIAFQMKNDGRNFGMALKMTGALTPIASFTAGVYVGNDLTTYVIDGGNLASLGAGVLNRWWRASRAGSTLSISNSDNNGQTWNTIGNYTATSAADLWIGFQLVGTAKAYYPQAIGFQ